MWQNSCAITILKIRKDFICHRLSDVHSVYQQNRSSWWTSWLNPDCLCPHSESTHFWLWGIFHCCLVYYQSVSDKIDHVCAIRTMLGGVFSGSILFSFAEILEVMGEAHPLFPSQSSNYNTTDVLCSMLKQVVVVKYWDYWWRLLVPLYESGKYQLSSNEQLLAPAGEILSLSLWLTIG